jgi:predicted anti-sigma-YlaC factor YlaD
MRLEACQDVVEAVTDAIERTLDPVLARQLRHHLDECPDCAAYVAQVRWVVEHLRGLGEPDLLPAERVDALTERFRLRTGRR